MSGLMDKAKEKLGQKENNFGQPGDKVEGQADNSVNAKIDGIANNAGVPQQDDGLLNKIVDNKVNSDIPGGN